MYAARKKQQTRKSMKENKRWLNFPESFERKGTKALCITILTGKFPHLEVKDEIFPLSKVQSVELNRKMAGSRM